MKSWAPEQKDENQPNENLHADETTFIYISCGFWFESEPNNQ